MNDDGLLVEAAASVDGGPVEDVSYGYRPINWRDMDAQTLAVAIAELDEWVGWLVHRYPLPETLVPSCWAEHDWLVEELSALHTGWLVCFDEEDSGLGPLQWHERFHQARERIRDWNGQCTRDEHVATRTRP